MLNTTEDTLTAFPAPGTIICACDEDAACAFHAAALYTPPVPVDTADDARRTFEDASADFYIPGWTPDDADTREHDRKILDDMIVEATNGDPAMARVLLALYPDEAFIQRDLDAMRKYDAKDWDAGEGEV